MNKNKVAFLCLNVVLIAVVGLILGFCAPVTRSNSLLICYIALLVTLLAPSLIYLLVKDATSPMGIISILFAVGNVAILIVFMCMHTTISPEAVAITEGSIVGLFLVASMIVLACSNKPKEE